MSIPNPQLSFCTDRTDRIQRRRILAGLPGILAWLILPAGMARGDEFDPMNPGPDCLAHPEHVLVRFNADASPADRQTAHQAAGALEILHVYHHVTGLELVKVAAGAVDQAVASYQLNAAVKYAEPDRYLFPTDTFPNDADFDQLWGLHNTGQTVNGDPGTAGADINAPAAWDLWTGDPDYVVAVIDSGINYNHPDLVDNMWVNPDEIADNNIDDDGNGYIDDIYGIDTASNDTDPMDWLPHGSHCAGTIGGQGNNGLGVVGVNWECRLMALLFIGPGSTCPWSSGLESDCVECMEYVIDKDVKVSSNSYRCYGDMPMALYDVIEASQSIGHLFVCAAGNESNNNDTNPTWPASFDLPNLICVAATNNDDNKAGFTNYGVVSVDIGAPGVNVYSTVLGEGYAFFDGTSMATPHTAGAVALVRSRFPGLPWEMIKERLLETARPIDDLQGITVTGGVVDAFEFIHVDCNTNLIPDLDDISNGTSLDCNNNLLPDECDLDVLDCNTNNQVDPCEGNDCNTNGRPDECDLGGADCDGNGTPDECDVASSTTLDIDSDDVLDECDSCVGLFNPNQAATWLTFPVESSSSGHSQSMKLDLMGRIALAYYFPTSGTTGELRVWHDADGNRGPDASEIHVIDNVGNTGQYASLAIGSDGRAAVAYHRADTADLKLWFDADGDFAFDEGELNTIESANVVGRYCSIAFDPAGLVTISFLRTTGADMRVFHDANGNYAFDATESKTIDTLNDVGQYTSLAFDANGLATVSYLDNNKGDLKVWHDITGDFAPDGGEIKIIDSGGFVGQHSSLAFDAAGRATVAYYDASKKDLKLWHDADGDFKADSGEAVAIDKPADSGQYASLAFDPEGRALVSYYRADAKDLRLWYDKNGDFGFDAGERLIPQADGDVGAYTALLFLPDLYAPIIAYRDDTAGANALTLHLDWDGDGACFVEDNCPSVANPDQADSDGDGVGDLCTPVPCIPGDMSADGVIDLNDVGPFTDVIVDPSIGSADDLCRADCNVDGDTDGDDIAVFVDLLLGG